MANHIKHPTQIEAAGTGGKIIREFIGAVNTGTKEISIARMSSPQGWEEPAQAPEFNEYTIVLAGEICIRTKDEKYVVKAGEAFLAGKGELVQYSTPTASGAEYIAVCAPAFSPDSVHREE
jgi:quercetin dioxygenase-like cupin family protein